MKTIATVEARMNSSRLPGKVLLEVNGRPLLEYLIERLKKVQSIDDIVLATTINPKDDILEKFALDRNLNFYRGSENDVMGRILETAQINEANTIIEITGDCPLVDPDIIEQAIRVFKKNNVDYLANNFFSSYPGGMDTQVIKTAALQKSYSMTNNPEDLEHVTLHIKNNPSIFSHIYLVAPPSLHFPSVDFILDELSDYKFLKKVIEELSKKKEMFTCLDMIQLIKNDKEISCINSHVKRNEVRSE